MTVLAIDWSGARRPAGKLWLAEAAGDGLTRLESFASREAAINAVLEYGRSGERVVAGFDFSFSLPQWFLDARGLVDAPHLWAVVRDEGEGWLSGCAPPFWGRPGKRRPSLPAHLRGTEARVGRLASIAPKSTFQIGGAGAVGTGSLRGMPHLLTLQGQGWSIWPFDAPGRRTVVEIYPRLLTGPVTKSRPEARERYLARSPWRWTAAHRKTATGSEDAFDAAVSALVMADHVSAPEAWPIGEASMTMEGAIWVPPAI